MGGVTLLYSPPSWVHQACHITHIGCVTHALLDSFHMLTHTHTRQASSRILGTGPCFRLLTVGVKETVWNEAITAIVLYRVLYTISFVVGPIPRLDVT